MFKDIPLKSLMPSKFNYRSSCDAAALEELTASVKMQGILLPILVRPLAGKAKGKFEIVAGHRRHQAAVGAGLKEMPCMVHDYTDEEAIEVQVVENTQRENPNPMDEAHGFKQLMEMGKHTPETLAAKIGHSIAYVLGRVRLAALDPAVQKKIASGEVGMGHAVLFTRLRDSGDQKHFLKEILSNEMSVRQAADELRGYTTSLASAEFDVAECALCPCRSRNQTELFPELKKKDRDECSDRNCYFTKAINAATAFIEAKAANGFKTLTEEKDVETLVGVSEYSTPKKGVSRIVSLKKDGRHYVPYPCEYKTKCMRCVDSHVFYLVVSKEYDGRKNIKRGEICLDKPCLDAMNKIKGQEPFESSSRQSATIGDDRRRELAAECRDRFLRRELAPKVEASEVLQKRLCLYALTLKCECRVAVMNRLSQMDIIIPAFAHSYNLVAGVPEGYLSDAILAAMLALLQASNGEAVLLAMGVEAGVNVRQDFAIDREWLESKAFKNKEDLIKLVEEMRLDIDVNISKAKLIEAVLNADDLKGKIPKEIIASCEDRNTKEEPAADSCGESGGDE